MFNYLSISSDGIIEGIEYLENKNQAFLQRIKCHSERFSGCKTPFLKNIFERFVIESERLKILMIKKCS